jgi:RNA recognition motif-containing protein
MRIYVGNLAMETSSKQLRAIFEPHGQVQRARLAKDKETGVARGFAIVEMEDGPAQTAIAALRGCSIAGRKLKVREAKPLAPKPKDEPGASSTPPTGAEPPVDGV